MMTINELSLGSKISFGSFSNSNDGTPSDICWRKADDDNTFLANYYVCRLPADGVEPESPNASRRERGSNFFPQSNLLQWLNGIGSDWFTPQTEHDVLSEAYAGRSGFLTSFSPWELSVMLPIEFSCAVPRGFTREFGEIATLTRKVTIPAISQVCGMEDNHGEGRLLPGLVSGVTRNILTRTSFGSGYYTYDWGPSSKSQPPFVRTRIVPMIRLDGSVNVVDEPDEDGVYEVCPPIGDGDRETREELIRLLLG